MTTNKPRISYEYPRLGEHDHDDPIPDAIWYRVDQSNSYWIYVDHPSLYLGGIPVGIQRAYSKELSSDDARAMAQALLEAADEWDALKAEAERKRSEDNNSLDTTTSASVAAFRPPVF